MNESTQVNDTAVEPVGDSAGDRAIDQASGTAGFRRVLLVVDESSEARAAARYADDVARQFAGTVDTLTVTEAKARQRVGRRSGATRRGRDVTTCAVSGPTVGARSHLLAEEVARSAEDFGADVVVLGLSRSRLARHRLAPSLRALVAQATEVPVLLAPTAWGGPDLSDPDLSDPDQRDADHDGSPLSAERTGLARSGRYARV
jgi:nucleotide-binding universal stress UspA family protein